MATPLVPIGYKVGRAPTFIRNLAYDLHELLELPLDDHHDPSEGFRIIKSVLTVMTGALRCGEYVHVEGFGIFRCVTHKPRPIMQPFVSRHAAERSMVREMRPPKTTITFQPSEIITTVLNKDNPNAHERRAMKRWGYEAEYDYIE
mgnify:CR=1 FL=1